MWISAQTVRRAQKYVYGNGTSDDDHDNGDNGHSQSTAQNNGPDSGIGNGNGRPSSGIFFTGPLVHLRTVMITFCIVLGCMLFVITISIAYTAACKLCTDLAHKRKVAKVNLANINHHHHQNQAQDDDDNDLLDTIVPEDCGGGGGSMMTPSAIFLGHHQLEPCNNTSVDIHSGNPMYTCTLDPSEHHQQRVDPNTTTTNSLGLTDHHPHHQQQHYFTLMSPQHDGHAKMMDSIELSHLDVFNIHNRPDLIPPFHYDTTCGGGGGNG